MNLKALAFFLISFIGNRDHKVIETPNPIQVRYLYNSGWLVETTKHIILIDYVPAPADTLDNHLISELNRAKKDGKQPFVMVTHEHDDHFYKPLLDWGKQVNGLQFIMGWNVNVNDQHIYKVTGRNSIKVGELTVDAHPANDDGSSFLIKVDDFEMYHAGDHALWADALRADFIAEINFIRSKSTHLSLAFVPVAKGKFVGCKTDDLMMEGAFTTIKLLNPQIVFPMHMACNDFTTFQLFAKKAKEKFKNITVYPPTKFDEKFNVSFSPQKLY